MMTLISRFQTNDGRIIILDEDQQKRRFFDIYNIANRQLITSKNRDKCFPTKYQKPSAPTLAVLSEAYGEEVAESWMVQQLQYLNETIGVKQKMNEFQVMNTSVVLSDKFSDGTDKLNVREILLFFFKLIGGEYGHFYGCISPDVINEAAEKFLEWRHGEIRRIERSKEDDERNKRFDDMCANAAPPPPEAKKALEKLYNTFGK